MALVTDSFCERCGTRYVFQAPPSKTLSIKGARVLAKGLRNFVLNDGQSLNDSLVSARSEDQSEDSSRLTQAFHQAFNFCMDCRQYACEKCWNVKVGACLTCAPLDAVVPTSPETHLIVRTPVTRVDGDLAPHAPQPAQPPSIEPSAFGGESSPAGPASFSPGLVTTQPGGAVHEAPLWPQADLTVFEAPATRTPEWLLRRGSTDGEIAAHRVGPLNQWPTADPLAPEMTLTAEELSLVSAQLAPRSDAGEPDKVDEDVPGVTAQAEQPEQAAEPEQAEQAAEAEQAPEPEQAAEPAFDLFADWQTPPPAEGPQPVVEPQALVEPQVGASAPTAELPTQPASLASRLFGLGAHRNEQPIAPGPLAVRGTPGAGSWPHVTPWLERPVRAHSPIFEDEPVATPTEVGLAAEPVAEIAAEEPQPFALAEIESVAPAAAEPQPVEPGEIPFSPAWQRRVMAAQAATASLARGQVAPRAAQAVPAVIPPAAVTQPAAVNEPAAVVQPAAPLPVRVPQAPVAQAPVAPVPLVPATIEQPAPTWPPLAAQYPAPIVQGPVWPAPIGVPTPAAMLSTQAARTEMWVQSSQEVMNRGTVRVCLHCSLPLSTQARFCRRCGTSQS